MPPAFNRFRRRVRLCCTFAPWVILLGAAGAVRAQAPLPIYTDHLANGFQDWSWAPDNLTNSGPYVYSGSNSISVSPTAQWQALSLHQNNFSTGIYTNVSFWINGGSKGGQMVNVFGVSDQDSQFGYTLPTLSANTWMYYSIPLSKLGVANQTNCNGFWFQLANGNTNTFYVDSIQLNAAPAPSVIHVSLDATNVLRIADARWFGINTAVWDSYFDTPSTKSELTELGLQFLRFPGGSISDDYHWALNVTDSNTWHWATTFTNFAHIATNLGVQEIITANYGTGSPAEAAAWVTDANLVNSNGFKYWEIGNEEYGNWETDSNAFPHDPYCYATNAAAYIRAMKAANPTIKIGVVSETGEDTDINSTNHAATNSVTGQVHYGWTPVMLSTFKQLGVQPDFLIYHWYPEYTDQESDPLLLAGTGNWTGDAASLRSMIDDYFGPPGTNIELLVTENNSNSGAQGKQSVSLVNALYYADSFGQLTQTEFNSFIWWDLRNGVDDSGNLDPSLYGWRLYGDLGIMDGLGTTLTNRYPTYYAIKLMQYFMRAGDAVLPAASDYPLLSAYAARRANGSLTLLVINKDSEASFNASIAISNFIPNAAATLYSYGMPQDNAANTGAGSGDIAAGPVGGAGDFTYTFAPYSATVFAFAPSAPALSVSAASSNPGQVSLQLTGQPNTPYVLQTSTNLMTWTPVLTNTIPATGSPITALLNSAGQQYWRAIWQP